MPVRPPRGFSMMEILVAIAIVAVLATLAVPGLTLSYARNQILDSAPLIDVAKKQVAAHWAASGDLPTNNAEAGLPPPDKMVNNYVKSVTITDGVIDILFGHAANAAIADKVLTFRPAVVEDAPIVPVAWVCGAGPVPPKMTVRGQDRTSAPMNALPVNCR
ncbi:MAG: pilin [Burkholderiales bacterium]|nr:pilin [Burkholderiales bacterium]